ncbi:MAG: hypothetical protein KKH94_05725 [Candidatus Omnitrophica bacterium]|nr:hypothetical protein [Candidatus Omnitrophota bacterium]
MKHKKRFTSILALFVCFLFLLSAAFLSSCGKKSTDSKAVVSSVADIDYYTCEMHPPVHISTAQYVAGEKSCPICNMNLIPVKKVR